MTLEIKVYCRSKDVSQWLRDIATFVDGLQGHSKTLEVKISGDC